VITLNHDRKFTVVSESKLVEFVSGGGPRLISLRSDLLDRDPVETFAWNCTCWVPAVLRRIGSDAAAADAIIEAIPVAPSHSARIPLLALLGKGGLPSTARAFFAIAVILATAILQQKRLSLSGAAVLQRLRIGQY
jgi:hypothetical protein